MKVNKKDNLDSSKNSKSDFLLQDLLEFDKNVFIGLSLLAAAIYLINILIRPNISPDIQGFLVVIIGLLLIVAIDFFKKDSNSTSSNVRGNYPRIENNYYYTYNGDYSYQNNEKTNYYSEKNIEQVTEEIKQIIDNISQNTTNSNIEDMPIIEAELIERIKHNEPEITKNLTDKDLSIVAKTIETIEQNKPLQQRVIDALKAGSNEAFRKYFNTVINSPGTSIIIAAIEAWNSNETDINNSDIKD
ncbi:MAG: hypothetical protein AB4057_06545 [Crocosphaera sp.]